MTTDTIFALSSGPPPAGVGVVRISGPASFAVATRLTGRLPSPRAAVLAPVVDPDSGQLIDRGIVIAFEAPASFTGEDVVEFQVHGGAAVISCLLGCLERNGLRHAEPGEFARRAFDNGKLDLTQAEGLADLIDARTETQRLQALAQAGGRLREGAERWRWAIVGLMAGAESSLDFSDEADVVLEDDRIAIGLLRDELRLHLAQAVIGERVRDGFTIAVLGEPNVGKSSLVNALAQRDVAIVSDMPGTTRDVIEVQLDLAGVAVTLVDTAGLRESSDPVEQEGVARARARAGAADLVLHVAEVLPEVRLGEVVLSKCDIAGVAGGRTGDITHVSAHTGAGMAELEQWLIGWARRQVRSGEPALVSRARQRSALARSVERLDEAILQPDVVLRAESLRLAARALDEITGRIGTDDVLDGVFQRFCIGK